MKIAIALAAGVISAVVCTQTQAALVHQWTFNNPTPLNESPNGTTLGPGGGSASPTFLATGGIGGSGAYQFDGVDDYFVANTYNGPYTFLGNSSSSWTAGFWIKTTDSGVNSGYAGTPKVPVLGNETGGVGFGLGIDGGLATFKHYNAGWQTHQGTTNVADGNGHYVTFVSHGMSTIDIYVDGYPDVMGVANTPGGFTPLGPSFGRSYFDGVTATYGAFTLDEFRVYNTALDGEQIRFNFAIPEPASIGLLGAGALMMVRRRRA